MICRLCGNFQKKCTAQTVFHRHWFAYNISTPPLQEEIKQTIKWLPLNKEKGEKLTHF